MSKPRRFMQIQLNAEQTERLLDWSGKAGAAEVEADCEPSGYQLEISVWSGCSWVEAVGHGGRLDLGDVTVDLLEASES